MHKPLLALFAAICVLNSYSQKTDTLTLYYKTDQFKINKDDQAKLDAFINQGWDRITVSGYTDETDEEGYNMELSKKRSGQVYEYLMKKNVSPKMVSSSYFGETSPFADNASEQGRAQNRRTTVIGYQFKKFCCPKPKEDPMKPVTATLDNGISVTFRPGAISDNISDNFFSGSGANLQVITSTIGMREQGLYNNTTTGDILSSVTILCPTQIEPCLLDSPVLLRVPVPFEVKCELNKVQFYNTTIVDGKKIWELQEKMVTIDKVGDKSYMNVWVDNFCGCVNFDFKIPDCFETDSTQLYYVNGAVKNLSAELGGVNSIYLPRKIDDNTQSLVYIKDEKNRVALSFTLYEGKKRVRTFRNRPIEIFPYDSVSNKYLLQTGSQKFSFPGSRIYDVVLKVNGDKYRIYPETNSCEVFYLKQRTENIVVDFTTTDRKGRITLYKDQPIESFPQDPNTGYRIIDRDHLKLLRSKGTVADLYRMSK